MILSKDRSQKPIAQPRRAAFRGDIQGLRAIAVGIVVLYHFWPKQLPGGFIGVDIFFVISGFLITSHLLSKPPRTFRDIGTFWMRRVKRLLPASFLVIIFSLLGVRLLAPETLWQDWGFQSIAATFYFQNWFLATSKVDYLAEADAPSPFQHFWSLSVEEQFYLVWPILIALLLFLAVRYGFKAKKFALIGIGLVVALSLAYSIYWTATDAGSAYFSTLTRGWEFGIGALVAAFGERAFGAKKDGLSLLAAWVGLAALVLSALTFTGQMAFPGYIALLPVLGTALILLAHSTHKYSPNIVLENGLMRFFGDNSYAIYLWHWPLMVLIPFAIDEFHLPQKIAVLALAVLLSVLTQKVVEVRFRKFMDASKILSAPKFLVAGSAIVAVLAAGFYNMSTVEIQKSQDIGASVQEVKTEVGEDCLGPAALGTTCKENPKDGKELKTLAPEPIVVKEDKPELYDGNCFISQKTDFQDKPVCSYGDGKKKVALVGNSHATQWLPALEPLAKKNNWKIDAYVANSCAIMGEPQEFDSTEKSDGCAELGDWVSGEIEKKDYDLVISSNRLSVPITGKTLESSEAPSKSAYEKILTRWEKTGAEIAVIRDTPWPGESLKNVPDCVAENLEDPSHCSGKKSDWVPSDPQADAVKSLDNRNIVAVDMNDQFCKDDRCYGVVGGIIAYWDHSHLSRTFASFLSDPLGQRLAKAVDNDSLFSASK
ncbi:acyltransferase family protein [Glutamicibacter ardleyensis]|uniref:acyltransferase family protein n=1 Tax=Glutamicibacter ardleyensis TaxID=225894 RepID=UPI003FD26885